MSREQDIVNRLHKRCRETAMGLRQKLKGSSKKTHYVIDTEKIKSVHDLATIVIAEITMRSGVAPFTAVVKRVDIADLQAALERLSATEQGGNDSE